MVRFSDPLSNGNDPGSEDVRPSPDGEHFAVVTTKGLLSSDQIESDVIVFERERVSAFLKNPAVQPPKPRIIATIVSFPHREEANAYAPVIKDLHWSLDGTSVIFKGENPTGAYQLYVAAVDGSGVQTLTPGNESVGRFDVGKDLIVYTASQPNKDHVVRADWINPDAQVVTGHSLSDVLFPGQLNTIEPESFTMWVLRYADGRWNSKQLSNYSVEEIPYLSFLFPFTLSPKGDKLIGLTAIPSIPAQWSEYEPASGFEHKRFHGGDLRDTSATLFLRPQQYSLIDLASGEITSLVGAPNARVLGYPQNNRLAWAADESRVLVTNTFLRLDPPERRRPCAVASVDLPSLVERCLFYEDVAHKPDTPEVEEISFGADSNEALVSMKESPKDHAVKRYRFADGEWKLATNNQMSPDKENPVDLNTRDHSHRKVPRLSIRQSLNDPPALWATDTEADVSRQLWNPNPQFAHIQFGDASLYRWKDNMGYEWSGILVKPVGYSPGKRYPCVLQMYQFNDNEFLTDGLYPTAFAARHLASAGFVVLQIRKRPTVLSEADPQNALEGYRSAIENLAVNGLIDRSRVGVVGFSWTSWYVVNALIKEPRLFAAATIADGLDNSYMQYLLTAESPDIQRTMERIRTSRPFGTGLQRWVEQAPGFHLDQVQTPLRIEAINPMSVLQEWELYSSLRIQNKPVDLIYFPHGTHIHQRPFERLESQQGDVDWFQFWLQNHEDPDPAKRSQYERWRELKREPVEGQPPTSNSETR